MKILLILQITITVLFLGCSSTNSSQESEETGTIEVVSYVPGQRSKQISKQRSTQKVNRVTSWNNLIAKVSADEMVTVSETLSTSNTYIDTVISLMIDDITSGSNRTVTIWTENSFGDTINGPKFITKDVKKNMTTTYSFARISAVRGSLIFEFAGVNSKIKKGSAKFILTDTTYSADTGVVSTGRLDFGVDNIPHGATGTVAIFALDEDGDEIAIYRKEITPFTFTAEIDSSIVISWGGAAALGTVSIEIGVASSGVTLFTGIMDEHGDILQQEQSGELLICEIQPEAKEEFIEIYNSTTTQFSEELTLEIIKSSSKVYNLGIVTINAGARFVIGAEDPTIATYVDKQIASLATDIASTGAMILLKKADGTLIDRLFFSDEKEYGWNYKNDHSFVLTKLTATENDFGKFWQIGETVYTSSQQELFGTPGEGGK